MKKSSLLLFAFLLISAPALAMTDDLYKELAAKMQKTISKTFTDHLSKCEVYAESYVSPISNETLYRRILGLDEEGGKCAYEEDMPKKMKIICAYPKDKLAKFAAYYEKVRAAKHYSFQMPVGNTLAIKDIQSVEVIDGEIVQNSSQTFLRDGTCMIKGR